MIKQRRRFEIVLSCRLFHLGHWKGDISSIPVTPLLPTNNLACSGNWRLWASPMASVQGQALPPILISLNHRSLQPDSSWLLPHLTFLYLDWAHFSQSNQLEFANWCKLWVPHVKVWGPTMCHRPTRFTLSMVETNTRTWSHTKAYLTAHWKLTSYVLTTYGFHWITQGLRI